MAQKLLHLLHGYILPDTVGWSDGERQPRVRVMYDLLWVLLQAPGDEPTFRPERVGMREIARITVDGPEVNPGLCAFGNIASVRV